MMVIQNEPGMPLAALVEKRARFRVLGIRMIFDVCLQVSNRLLEVNGAEVSHSSKSSGW